jgi:hypothetical protein
MNSQNIAVKGEVTRLVIRRLNQEQETRRTIPYFLVKSRMFGYMEQKLLGRSQIKLESSPAYWTLLL